MQKAKLQFEETTHPAFYRELKRDLSTHFTATGQSRFATPYFWYKAALNLTIMMIAYLAMVLGWVNSPLPLLACAVTFGVASLLLIFNVAHDAVHGTLSPKR